MRCCLQGCGVCSRLVLFMDITPSFMVTILNGQTFETQHRSLSHGQDSQPIPHKSISTLLLVLWLPHQTQCSHERAPSALPIAPSVLSTFLPTTPARPERAALSLCAILIKQIKGISIVPTTIWRSGTDLKMSCILIISAIYRHIP